MTEYLIDEKYVKETVNISTNFDSAALKKSIRQVNRLYIQHLLGIPLLDYLTDNYNSLTTVYTDLLIDVKDYFALLVQYDLLSTLGIKTTNKSTSLTSDSSADINSIKLEMGYLEAKYALLKADILAYLNVHASEIPQYVPQVTNLKFTGIAFTPVYNNKIYGG